MTKNNIEIRPLTDEHIEGVALEGSSFDKLIDKLGVMPSIQRTDIAVSRKNGDDDTVYILQLHELPGPDGEVITKYCCSCASFQYGVPKREDMNDDDIPADLAAIAECKHADEARRRHRHLSASDAAQSGFDSF